MATAGSIVVDLLARTGSFDTDITRSTKAAEKRMKEMERTVNEVGAKVGLAMAAGFAAATAAMHKWIGELDRLNDVADVTGASIENISALEDVALRAGNSFESVEAALIKFNTALKDTDGDGKAARALEAIGLKVQDLRKLDPAEALHQTALALAGFADDGDKARLVMELFGKSVKEVGPFLKDLAEKGQLVATATTEQAKQAEAFNKQLAAMQKNVTDLGRSFAADLLPQINATLSAMKEGGLLGFLGVGGDQSKDPAAALAKINGELATLRKLRAELDPEKSLANRINDFVFGDVGDLDRQIKALEAQEKYLKALQASMQPPPELGPDVRPGVGPLPAPGKPPGKAAKPHAWSTTYTEADALQREQEQRNEALKLAAQSERDMQRQLQALLDLGPTAQQEKQLETQRGQMQLLADAFMKGAITAEQFNDAATGALNLTGTALQENTRMADQFGSVFGNVLQDLVSGGQSFNDVLKNMMGSLANMILQIGVIEPMIQSLRAAMGAGGSGGGGLFSLLGGIFGGGGGGGFVGPPAPTGGARAGGGPVSSGRSYLVGERGPELFVPRTAGMVVPNGAGGAGAPTIINQTRGRVDNVVQQELPGGGRAFILQELASEFANPNSKVSRSLQTNYRLRPAR